VLSRPRLASLAAFLLATLAVEPSRAQYRGGYECRSQPYPNEGKSAWPREFYYTRGIYQGTRCNNWTIDYPKSDRQFLMGVRRLIGHIDAYEMEHPVRLDDPNLRRYPFLYMVEVGHSDWTDQEAAALRSYIFAGGFVVVDDFWGTYEWEDFESNIRKVLPEYKVVELPLDHPLFHMVYDIKEILQVPNVGNAQRGITYEKDGYVPHCRGIFDDQGRLLVVINWNTDLGDAWEWAENPYYPLKYSTFAYQMGINFIVYSMSH
jgi:hypothetical protein